MNPAVHVHPQAQAILDQIAAQASAAPKLDDQPTEAERVALVRQAYAGTAGLGGESEAVASVADKEIAGPGGLIPVRIYQPRASATPHPVLLWFHGGSFIAGDLDTHDRPLRMLVNRLGFPVVAVAWRLAPEHPFPAGLDDAHAALRWAALEGSPGLNIDPGRIAIGGDSAGGAIAAALSQRVRDQGGPPVAAQVLLYPNTDLDGDGSAYPSWRENDRRILTRSDMERNFALYAGKADRGSVGVSPIRAPDLAGLPPTIMATAEADPQRDEGEAYAAKLRAAGVIVEHVRYPGMIHGFFQMAGVVNAGRDLIEASASSLQAMLARQGTP